MRVSTLPRIGEHVEPEAERVQLRGPARGAGADLRADRQLAEGEPVAGHHGVARVLAQRYGDQVDVRGRGGRQVLEGVHGDVAATVEQRGAQRADEDAGAAHAGQRGVGDVAVGGDLDELDLDAEGRADRVGDVTGLGAGEHGAAGADPDDGGQARGRRAHVVRRGAHGCTPSARVTASTDCWSRENRSASAAA